MTPNLCLAPLLAMCALASPRSDGFIEHVDYYGLRSIDVATIQSHIDLKPGTPSSVDRDALREKLLAIDGIADARVMLISTPSSSSALVGIREEGTPLLHLREAPTRDLQLPEALHAAYRLGMDETMNGFKKGFGGEESPNGHAMSTYPPARVHDETTEKLVPDHLELLRETLRFAASDQERTLAAHAIAYAPNKQDIVDDLCYAITDPAEGVRNNAVRALSVLARWSNSGGHGLKIDADPTQLIAMLDSFEWTDRNKGAALLEQLTVSRPDSLMAHLRADALPALEEMALWHSAGHAFFSVRILARLAGLNEDEIQAKCAALNGVEGYDARAEWVSLLVEAIRRG